MIDYLQKGGPLMWVLLGLSILCGGVFLERILFLNQITIPVADFLRGLSNLIREKRWAEAQIECAAVPAPVTRVLHAAVLRHNQPREELRAIVQDAGQLEVSRLERRINILSAASVIAPLIGLLGTVVGLLNSFTNLSAAQGSATPAEVAAGVYQSLITAALGLVVAIPAYLCYAFLSARARAIMHDLERAGVEVVNLIEDARDGDNIVEFRHAGAAEAPVARARGHK